MRRRFGLTKRVGLVAARFAALAAAVHLTGAPASAAGQFTAADYTRVEGVSELATRCAAGQVAFMATCREMSLAVMAAQQGVGLVAVLGSDFQGTSSTLGRRLGTIPRFGVSVSASALRAGMPNVGAATAGELAQQQTALLAGLRGTVAAGVLDGFQPAPTVGGIFSVDVIAAVSVLRLPTDAGFAGSGAAFGAGARVGLIRESFTLPGISVAASRTWHGDVEIGSAAEGRPGHATSALTVSSLRATGGKNWFVIGLMGGVGWDRYEGDVQLAVPRFAGDRGHASGFVRSERVLYFVSGWFNFLLTRLSVELGRADGVGDPFAGRSGGYDPSNPTWFASGTFRITL